MRKLFILLFFSASSLLMAQNTNPIQEAMANYDYETALTLIDKDYSLTLSKREGSKKSW